MGTGWIIDAFIRQHHTKHKKLESVDNNRYLEDNINTGTIPFENYTNSKLQPLTRSAEIKGRDVGQISLEDESGTGSVILNGTDGSSTNAGDQITFELGTFEDIERS